MTIHAEEKVEVKGGREFGRSACVAGRHQAIELQVPEQTDQTNGLDEVGVAEILKASDHLPDVVYRRHNHDFGATGQGNAVGFFETVDSPQGPIRYPGVPAWFSRTPGHVAGPAPELGADTRDVLTELGLL